jgi:hypothetical protein
MVTKTASVVNIWIGLAWFVFVFYDDRILGTEVWDIRTR